MIHKAMPALGYLPSVCVHCQKDIKQVPGGGSGPTWIHAGTSMVIGEGEAIHQFTGVKGEYPYYYGTCKCGWTGDHTDKDTAWTDMCEHVMTSSEFAQKLKDLADKLDELTGADFSVTWPD